METWQIALIICSAVLAFGVACVSILTCYCKARRRLQENEEYEEAGYYHPTSTSPGETAINSGGYSIPRSASNPGQLQQSLKASPPTDFEPIYTYNSSLEGTNDRIGVGLPSRRSNGSAGDLAGSYGSNDRRPSQGSYTLGRRPSEEVYYTSRDRDAMAVEL